MIVMYLTFVGTQINEILIEKVIQTLPIIYTNYIVILGWLVAF